MKWKGKDDRKLAALKLNLIRLEVSSVAWTGSCSPDQWIFKDFPSFLLSIRWRYILSSCHLL